ncbi:AI-2E family transporter [Legionella jordanis]|uniref:Transporter, permease n=2 Tax=Legionella jordanis TaxID=456 RepID=A0A0W0VBM5_9GAMM|nr:AI-2E family transporter [Legionella jordanis]KTD17033.1 transporter, permease [Legionella jordanis]VEH12771.1 transporter, permease [Legionella jordanis]
MEEQEVKNSAGWELKILGFLAICFIFYIGYPLLFPLFLSFFLYSLLNPFMQFFLALKLPRMLAAAIITVLIVGLLSLAISVLMGPASEWVDKAPENFDIIEHKFSFIKKPLAKLNEAIKTAEHFTDSKKVQKVEITQPTNIGYSIFDLTTNAIFMIFLTALFLFFLLVYLKTIFDKLAQVSTYRQTTVAMNFFHTVQTDISTYLGTFTLICIGLGAAIAVELYFLDLPNAALWGVMAALLNFIPYIGPSIGIGVVFFVSLLTFDSYIQILLPPLLYLLTSTIEGQIITPILIGHRMNLNPLVVFFSIVFWVWIWGIGGALLSIPLLAMVKIMMEHMPSISKYSLLLEK